MRAILIIAFGLFCASTAKCDSFAWPPAAVVCSDNTRSFLFIFDYVWEKKEFQSTTVYYLEYDSAAARYRVRLRRSVKVGLSPRFAFMTKKHSQILLLNESRFEDESQAALVVFDADSGTVVMRKTRNDLFPELHWLGSTSSVPWIASAELSANGRSLHIVTKKPEHDDDDREVAPRVADIDLATLETKTIP